VSLCSNNQIFNVLIVGSSFFLFKKQVNNATGSRFK